MPKKEKLKKMETEQGKRDLLERVSSDPKFRPLPRKERKVHIDSRFASMLTDSKFRLKYSVDKRGRPMHNTTDDHLRRFYELSSSSEKDEEEEEAKNDEQQFGKNEICSSAKKCNRKKTSTQKRKDSGGSSPPQDGSIELDLARGQGNILSSSDESSSEWEFEDDEIDHGWGELDRDCKQVEKPSGARLAICNMDWDRIRAQDLLVLLSSFKPEKGSVQKVSIYLSDFGRQQLAEEDVRGPKFTSLDANDDQQQGDEQCQDEEGNKLSRDQMKALRQYQLDRLKYYYAIVECDCAQTAQTIYEQCDGIEYESSAVRLDLRYVDDETSFAKATAKDEATYGDMNVELYRPRQFESDALQKSNVKLTWDQTDPERINATKAAFSLDADVDQFQNLVASGSSGDSSSDENGSENPRKKYEALFEAAGLDVHKRRPADDGNELQMQVSWVPIDEQSNTTDEKAVSVAEEQRQDGALHGKTGPGEEKSTTPWQKYLEKRKQKKRQRKADIKAKQKKARLVEMDEGSDEESDEDAREGTERLQLIMADDSVAEGKRHFSLPQLIQQHKDRQQVGQKRKGEDKSISNASEGDSFKLNASDQRFAAIYTNHLFSIDRTDPNYKDTGAMDLVAAKKAQLSTSSADELKTKSQISSSSNRSIDVETLKLTSSLKAKANRWSQKRGKLVQKHY